MKRENAAGHLAALLTVVIWGTTFISTKVLLRDFEPVEILFIRFVMGFAALELVNPRRLRGTTARQEGLFAAAGLCGVCLYYLLENIALTYTMASNVGVIISVAPFFTALLSRLFLRQEGGVPSAGWCRSSPNTRPFRLRRPTPFWTCSKTANDEIPRPVPYLLYTSRCV